MSDARTPTSHTHTKSEITDFPSLSTVATSGSYNDLSNKPTIPTVNNATLKIQKNGTDVKTFTANASSDVTCNITVPTKTSDLTNDSGFLTSHQDLSGYVPRSGGNVITGTTFNRTVNDSSVTLCGGTDWDGGASITLSGKDRTNDNGDVIIRTKGNSNVSDFVLRPNGTATWGNKNLAMQEDTVPRSGGAVITGPIFSRTVNDSEFRLDGGTTWGQGASLALSGKDRPGSTGLATLHTSDGTDTSDLLLRPNGIFALVTNGTSKYVAMQEDVVPRSGGYVLNGTEFSRPDSSAYVTICGGYGQQGGAFLALHSKGYTNANWLLRTTNGSNLTKSFLGGYDGTLAWDGTAIQYTSDKRLKQQITQIDNALLDAWEDVTPCQFKYNDAVDQKGDNARLHTGYVVQQIDEACQKHNIDISEYGLYCHEEYPERTEEVTIENEDGTTSKETKVIEPAREHYSLRYTETLVVECAYLRRENARLKERLQQHDEYFSNIEKRLQSLENS